MQLEVMLLGNVFFLAAVLIILLVVFFKNSPSPQENQNVREDLKKIKDQINSD
ncbi:MAG: hypothetical protein KC506_02195 [Nanoarchaeota archaeon]|nr:hypothetical protein [Nanoarchaeota archaeon]